MWKTIATTIGSAMLMAGAGAAADADLSRPKPYLPYQALPYAHVGADRVDSPYMGDSFVLMDVDRDGVDDLVYGRNGYVAAQAHHENASILHFQANIPPQYTPDDQSTASTALRRCGDLDGDGFDNVVAWGHTADRFDWRFWILEPTDGSILFSFDLRGEQDRRADGIWDGNFYVAGTVEVEGDEGAVLALVIGCNSGYDAYGRGMAAVDPRSGRVLWRYLTGPNPFPDNTRLADLDGDKRDEIIFVGRSPNNLGGELINGTSDDQTMLFVLDRQGQLLWSRHLGGWYGNGELDLGDMDGDGRLEIVTCTRTTPDVWGELAVWDGAGNCLASLASESQFEAVHLVARQDRTHPALLVGGAFQQVQEYDFIDGSLLLRRSVQFGGLTHINLVADLLPARGIEVVVGCFGGPSYVLDQDLKPIALLPASKENWCAPAISWSIAPESLVLLTPSRTGQAIVLGKASFAWQRLLPQVLPVAILLAGGSILLAVRRARHGRRTGQPELHLLRETRLNLLDNLELSNHGAIAPLKCVRRLVWHLQALQVDLGANQRVEVRMRETWSECHESALPHLRGIVDRARLAGLSSVNIEVVNTAAAEIESRLEALAEDNFSKADRRETAEALATAERRAGDALLQLRAEVASYFRADVAQAVAHVKAARSLDLELAGVELHCGGQAIAAGGDEAAAPPAETPVVGLCDPRELEFIIDNLVGNAIAAMAKSARRRLDIRWRTGDGMVVIEVADTGCGLREADWDRALNSHFSARPDGGRGLPASRKYLRKYGGNLSILRSSPGLGTTFQVIIPAN